MADDSQVAAQVINEHLQLIRPGLIVEDVHINSKTGDPSHYVEQGSFQESYQDPSGNDSFSGSGSFTLTKNQNHFTDVIDETSTEKGVTTETKITYTSDSDRINYNLVSHTWINGVDQGIVHVNTH